MLITARAEYACLAMLELAARHHDPRPVRLTEVTEKHGIPQRFLVQILLQMKAAGLVSTSRGASGGYRLSRPPEAITLADILGVLERMEKPEERNIAPSTMARGLQSVWKRLGEARMDFLQKIRLIDLVPSTNAGDYVI